MDNAMTEYKKRSKFAEIVDSLKFNARILFAGKNQDKIQNAILGRNEEHRFEALQSQADKLEDITEIINSMQNHDKFMCLARYANSEKIKHEALGEIILSLSIHSRISAMEMHLDKLGIQEVKAIINSLDKEYKVKGIYIAKERITSFADIQEMLAELSSEEKIEAISFFDRRMDSKQIESLILSLDSKEKFKALQMYEEKIKKIDIIKSMEDTEKEEAYLKYAKEIVAIDKARIIRTFESDKRKELVYEAIEDRNDPFYISLFMKEGLDDRERKEALSQYIYKLGTGAILRDVILSFEDETRSEIILEHLNDFNKEDMLFFINRLDDEKKSIALMGLEEGKLSNSEKIRIIGSMKDEVIIKDALERSDFTTEAEIDIVVEYMARLDERVLSQQNLLNKESIDLLGKEEHYQIFKYIVVPGDVKGLDISSALENPEKFNQYRKLAESYEKQGLPIQELVSRIQEYSVHSEVINSVLERESVEPRRLDVLESLVHDDPYEEIKGVEDLDKYPQLRYEKLNKEIEVDSENAIYKILLGVSKEDFQNITYAFTGSKSLAEELESMKDSLPEEEQGRVADVIAMLKVIEMISEMPEEQKCETLRRFNEDLSREFSGDSRIANIRNEMRGLKKDIREIFGQELSQALEIQTDERSSYEVICDEGEKDIEVIHLNGEKFKLLIHSIDFNDKGRNNHFEKREVGESHICTSLISDKFLGETVGNSVVVAFDNIGKEALIQEGSNDIASTPMSRYGVEDGSNSLLFVFGSEYGFKNSEQLLAETVKKGSPYNEVDLLREYMQEDGTMVTTMPSHIVCFDEIDEASKQEARLIQEKFGLDKPLPILVIHSEKYKDRIEEYARQVQEGSKEELQLEQIQQEEVEIEEPTIADKVEEIMEIASGRAEPKDIARTQLELISAQEQTQEHTPNGGYKKPTAMMSKDDGFIH